MKRLSFTFAILLASFATYAQTWNLDKSHSRVGFTVTHMMLTDVDGNFKTFDAKLTASKPDLSDAVFEVTADINSINTDNERRDGHLKGPDFFDAAKFPNLTFKSTSFQKAEGKKYKLAGDLTMHGVTKPVTLDVVMNGPVTQEGRNGKQDKVGFKVSGTIKRLDFGIGSSTTAVVSDEIELKGTAEFAKPQ
ncbi:YceI family protein [Spirosoma daeguense]